MENNKNKKSVKFQGDMLNFCDFIQVFVFTRNHHLKWFQTVNVNSMIDFISPCWNIWKKVLIIKDLDKKLSHLHQPQLDELKMLINISAFYANLPVMFFQIIRHNPFEKNVKG